MIFLISLKHCRYSVILTLQMRKLRPRDLLRATETVKGVTVILSDWPQISFRFFHTNELFGQPNICAH